MPKKVLIICYNYDPAQFPKEPYPEDSFYTYGFGGHIGKNFKKFLPPGYEIEVWRLDGYVKKYYEKKFLDVKFRIFPSFHKSKVFDFSFKFLRELRKENKKSKPILFVVHTHYWLTYQIAFFFRNSKIVSTHHGEWSPFFRLKSVNGLRKIKAIMDALIEKIVLKKIDYILTIDRNHIQYLKKANPEVKYIFWYVGINPEQMFPIPKNEAKKILNLDINKKYIFYVGRLYKYKHVDDLIKIWKDIQKNKPEVELLIAGNSRNDPWEEHYDLAVKSGATLLGKVLNKELNKYYSAADVYVLMALRNDYFGGPGIATLESLACNTPVVSYALKNYMGNNIEDLGETPNTIEGTKEAILNILENHDKYKNMRESVIKYYSAEVMTKRAEEVFEYLFEKYKSK